MPSLLDITSSSKLILDGCTTIFFHVLLQRFYWVQLFIFVNLASETHFIPCFFWSLLISLWMSRQLTKRVQYLKTLKSNSLSSELSGSSNIKLLRTIDIVQKEKWSSNPCFYMLTYIWRNDDKSIMEWFTIYSCFCLVAN